MNQDLASEFSGCDLGDHRRTRRLKRVVRALQARPAESFPKALRTRAATEAFYRLIEQPEVQFDALFEPHAESTVRRCIDEKLILAVHDSTPFTFGGDTRKGLGKINRAGHGFHGHFSIGVSADGRREPLGALAVKTWARAEPAISTLRRARKVTQAEVRKAPRESSKWIEGVRRVEARLEETGATAIHVMDSEADDYALFAELTANHQRFVARNYHNRKLLSDAGDPVNLKQVAITMTVKATRSAKLSARKNHRWVREDRRRSQPREGREARLVFRSQKVDLQRPVHVEKDLPGRLSINVVYVTEVDAPEEYEPVEWLLYTSEPAETAEDVLRVVDIYRARWVIEEFFKSLKTGCAFEKRQLESLHTLENALALFIPIAWGLLRLRSLSRDYPELSATAFLTKTQITILRKQRLLTSESPTIHEAMLAVAALGGHLKNNGLPGWIVLGRGYQDLLAMEAGFLLALARSDQS